VQQITIDDSAFEPSEFLRRSRFTVRPGFRSGVRVPLLIEHVAHLQGVLLKPDGQALGLEAGELKRVGDPAFSQPFFTNRSGQFWLEGLKSGRYEIELSEGTWKSVPIVVGVDQTGVAKLGAIRVEKKQ